jgi:sulfotransferase
MFEMKTKASGSNLIFLSGLPRTGSTLLTSILSQNPDIHTEPNSALCQLMWDMQVSCQQTEQIQNRPGLPDKLISTIPKVFYAKVGGQIIDKCRSWTLPANLDLITRYISPDYKMIVMTRPIIDIVKSFVFVREMNGWLEPEASLLDNGSEPIMRSLDGVNHARSIDNGQFFFISYDDLIENPQSVLTSLYDFCGWQPFTHDLTNIVNRKPERDDLLGLVGLHDIRPELGRRELDVKLSPELEAKAKALSD